jgi:hypothetical protein
VNYKGEVVTAGTATFRWYGLGEVFVVFSPSANHGTDRIWAADVLIVNGFSYKSSNQSGVYTIPCIDITATLHKGLNTIQAQIEDVYGAMIGCSPLYVVQVYGSGNSSNQGINANDVYDLGSKLLNQSIDIILNNPNVLPTGFPDLRPEAAKRGMKWDDYNIIVGGGEIFVGGAMCAVGLEFPGYEILIEGLIMVNEQLQRPTWVPN